MLRKLAMCFVLIGVLGIGQGLGNLLDDSYQPTVSDPGCFIDWCIRTCEHTGGYYTCAT